MAPEPTPLWGTTETELTIFGERLRDARVIQRLKAQAIAEKANLSPDRYSRLENRLSTIVDIARAHSLAVALGFPVQFLTAPPITPVQRTSLLFRASKGMSRAEEDQLVAWARLIGDLIQQAEAEQVRLPSLRLPRVKVGTTPVNAAIETRRALGLDSEKPIPHLTRAIERLGVYVAAIDFSAELHAKHHDAFSTWLGPSFDLPLVAVRAIDSWERTRMSIAHEIGHLVMHYVRRDGALEAEAYEFAAELLLPRSSLFERWPRQATLMALMPLKREWGMSLQSLIEHGYRNGLLADTQRTNLYKQMSNKRDRISGERWRVTEPGWTEREPERPLLVAKIVELAFGSDTNLASISAGICHWKTDYLQQLLSMQATPRFSKSTEAAAVALVIPLRSAVRPKSPADLDLNSEASRE
jgi:Zn-dependent peptidase ImmA (M78 family)